MKPQRKYSKGKGQSKQTVTALKIKKILAAAPPGAPYGRRTVQFEGDYPDMEVSQAFMKQQPEPKAGGYCIMKKGRPDKYMTAEFFENEYAEDTR